MRGDHLGVTWSGHGFTEKYASVKRSVRKGVRSFRAGSGRAKRWGANLCPL